jgi:hypothetical protein
MLTAEISNPLKVTSFLCPLRKNTSQLDIQSNFPYLGIQVHGCGSTSYRNHRSANDHSKCSSSHRHGRRHREYLPCQLTEGIISLVYFSYNATVISITVGKEWSTFATHRKGLRVSATETRFQRSTYVLQLPYRIVILSVVFLRQSVGWLPRVYPQHP